VPGAFIAEREARFRAGRGKQSAMGQARLRPRGSAVHALPSAAAPWPWTP
jgi:hypothetical protein